MRKWILTACLLTASLLAACSGSAGSAFQEVETVNLSDASARNNPTEEAASSTQPDFTNLFAEANRLYDQLEANIPIEIAPANASAQTGVLTIPTLFWINCEARVVFNLQQMPGIVSLDPASERPEVVVTFNADQTSLETIVARLEERGEEVTSWRILK